MTGRFGELPAALAAWIDAADAEWCAALLRRRQRQGRCASFNGDSFTYQDTFSRQIAKFSAAA